MNTKRTSLLGIAIFLVFAGVGCQQLNKTEPASTESSDQVAEQPETTKRNGDWGVYEDIAGRFTFEYPTDRFVSQQANNIVRIIEDFEPETEKSPPPDIAFRFTTLTRSEYIQELFDSTEERPQNIIVENLTATKEDADLIKYYPIEGDTESFCPSYFIESKPESIIISPWECSDIDYIEEVVKSLRFSQ